MFYDKGNALNFSQFLASFKSDVILKLTFMKLNELFMTFLRGCLQFYSY